MNISKKDLVNALHQASDHVFNGVYVKRYAAPKFKHDHKMPRTIVYKFISTGIDKPRLILN